VAINCSVFAHPLYLACVQAQLRHYLEHCPLTPPHLAAGLALLENMIMDEAFRPHWRLCALPAQHPGMARTWAAVWYRCVRGAAVLDQIDADQ
jgi:hypothetical protein